MKKKVIIQLPKTGKEVLGWDMLHTDESISNAEHFKRRYKIECDALSSVDAQLIEVLPGNPQQLIAAARDADAILLSWGIIIDAETISKLKKCIILASGSVGTDMIDVKAATAAGIVVTNAPDVFIEETADHTLMLLLSAGRRLRQIDKLVRQGDWVKGRPLLSAVPRFWGQTLGIIGFGNIGTAVARRAKAFGMQIIGYDPYVSELKMTAENVEPVSMQEVLERSDYLTLHTSLNSESKKMMGDAEFKAMKNSAILINCSRGGVVDETALIRALQKNEIAGAGLDVMEKEPPDKNNPLLSMTNVIVTPHAASATARMRPTGRRRAAEEVARALQGMWPISAVNPSVLPQTKLKRWQPIPMERGPNR